MTTRIVAIVSCLIVGLFVFCIAIAAAGGDVIDVLRTLATGGANSAYGFSETIVKMIPVLLCALAAAVPGRLGLVNIGGEGQLLLGAIGATFAVRLLPSMPTFPTLILMALCATLAGAAWGLLPGVLRGLTRASEIVITLLLNYVAALILLHLIHGPWKDPTSLGWPQTAALPENAQLPGLWGTRIHAVLWVALALCAVFALIDRRSVVGMASRVVGANPKVGRYIGLNVPMYYVVAFGLAGALAALGGFGELAGVQGRLRDGLSLGYGYAGFFVAWLCRNRFEWIPLGAFLFSLVITGADSLQVFSGMPFATVYLLQGLLFLSILGSGAVKEVLDQRIESMSSPR